MNTEETQVELQDAGSRDAERRDAELKDAEESPAQPPAQDADATEADVSEADLDQEEQEKQPMTGAGERGEEALSAGGEGEAAAEKNGAVKLKIPEEEEEEEEDRKVKFTGLNKEELLRVAGTPGWVRTRWALLVVFWLGWLGMLGGAVLIILQAPRCRELPATNW
nr:4F2 cell-surface antigen heavy chain-like [Labrus bergylta]